MIIDIIIFTILLFTILYWKLIKKRVEKLNHRTLIGVGAFIAFLYMSFIFELIFLVVLLGIIIKKYDINNLEEKLKEKIKKIENDRKKDKED